jgi:hypothetical protein
MTAVDQIKAMPETQRFPSVLKYSSPRTVPLSARATALVFEDPTSPLNAPPRESIEVRALVFFAPESQEAQSAAVPGQEASAISVR